MKNLLTLLSLSILLVSCGISKFGVLKKRYSRGYTLVGYSKIKEKSHARSNDLQEAAIKDFTENNDKDIIVANAKNELTTFSASDLNNKRHVAELPTTTKKSNNQIIKLLELPNKNSCFSIINKHQKTNFHANHNKKDNSDEMLIVLVILSLFPILSLIAIYLKDGKKITLNFWICLLLHFLFLYWLFALLRVLDIINLE
ncbi:MAG: hypothetical protein N3F09_06965 [Bacteroidia bacterium]|nr:hypothetical protein [Bacteroidia bacterium]